MISHYIRNNLHCGIHPNPLHLYHNKPQDYVRSALVISTIGPSLSLLVSLIETIASAVFAILAIATCNPEAAKQLMGNALEAECEIGNSFKDLILCNPLIYPFTRYCYLAPNPRAGAALGSARPNEAGSTSSSPRIGIPEPVLREINDHLTADNPQHAWNRYMSFCAGKTTDVLEPLSSAETERLSPSWWHEKLPPENLLLAIINGKSTSEILMMMPIELIRDCARRYTNLQLAILRNDNLWNCFSAYQE